MKSREAFGQKLLRAALRAYQLVFRPLLPWGCKYHPSCSEYAREAIERHGAAAGVRLAAGRILRCRPGVFGGYDPVPAGGLAGAESPRVR